MQTICKDTNAINLEAALPTLITKLQELQADLSPEEKLVFGEIIESASIHTKFIQSHDEGSHDIKMYFKPQSSHATMTMKQQYSQLPTLLGIKK
jgi:hypothetical protein